MQILHIHPRRRSWPAGERYGVGMSATRSLSRARLMLCVVVAGLFLSGVTIWPMEWELSTLVALVWGDAAPTSPDSIHAFLLDVLASWRRAEAEAPFLLYGFYWLAFAHIMLAVLFAMVIKDPIRNVMVVRFGLLCCVCVPVLAGVFIPIRGLPPLWFLVDSAFAPACALPLWICLRDLQARSDASSPGSS